MSKIRINKLLASANVASRRKVDEMILDGRIRLNGRPLNTPGAMVDPAKDYVTVNGHKVSISNVEDQEKVHFLFHKPVSVLSTCSDDRGRKTVLDYFRSMSGARLYSVGRLDYDAQGAILMTNDGELSHKLMHPKYHIAKRYVIKVRGNPRKDDLDKLRRGIYLEDGPTGPCEMEVVKQVKSNTWIEVVLTKGKYRQIKRMFFRIKNPVQKIFRTHFAGLSVEGLAPGEFRPLTKKELFSLQNTHQDAMD